MKPSRVSFTKRGLKDEAKCPKHVKAALLDWIVAVETIGLINARKIPGYHDEPLKGDREGQRSARLNRLWRVIYTEIENATLVIVRIEEVIPHAY